MRIFRNIVMALSLAIVTGCYFPQSEPNIIAKYEVGEKSGAALTEANEKFASPDLEKICAQNQKLSDAMLVSFAPTVGQECEWESGYNLQKGELGTRVSAFRVQTINLPIAAGHKICAVQLQTADKLNRYNDAMVLTLQDRLVASHSISSKKNALVLNAARQGLRLEKENLIGLTQQFGTFCPQGVECAIPRSLDSRPIKINVNPGYLKRFAQSELEKNLKLELIMTGNRSIVDCQHTGLEFNLRYTYIDDDVENFNDLPIAH